MKQTINTSSQRNALVIATILALVFGAYFLRHFFGVIAVAAILAFLFNSTYHKLLARWHSPGRAAATTLIIAMLAIIIPLTIVLLLTVLQVNIVLSHVNQATANLDFESTRGQLISTMNHFFESIGITFRITPEWINTALTTIINKVSSVALHFLQSTFTGFVNFMTTIIIFTYVFVSILRNQKELVRIIRLLNPLGDQASELYLQKVGAMTKAMVRGQFLIAIAQGTADAILLYIGGLHVGFFFFVMLLTVLSIIPLGGGIVAIPIGIIMMLTGNVAGGLIVILGHILIVTNIDNVLRPRLVPKEARLDSALLLLSVFAGIGFFGFMGIILGPVVMIIITTTIKVFLDVFKNVQYEDRHDSHPNEGVLKRTKRWLTRAAN